MKCAHCRLDFNEAQMLVGNGELRFCCTGCKGVYELIQSKQLGDFYEKLGKNSLSPVDFDLNSALNSSLAATQSVNSSQNLNLNSLNSNQNFQNLNSQISPPNALNSSSFDSFVRENDEGFSEIHLIINGIHCAACVWLNEKILISEEGILEASVNPITHKARVVFDAQSIDAARIVGLIHAVGYTASAYDPLKAEQRAVATRREFYSKLVVAVACVMNVMWIAVAKYAGLFSAMNQGTKDILNFAEFVLASPVLFYTGSAFYKSAYFSLKNRQISMDFLVIFGASLAYAYSIWAMFSRAGEVYFDSVAMIICFVFVGKYLEVLIKKHATDTMDGLNDFLKGEILVFDGEKFAPKEPYAVCVGDLIQLKTGDKVLIDGICVSGEASVDSSSLSGENEPLLVNAGKSVNSACVVLDGSLIYRASRLYKDSKLSQIISLLELCQGKKPKIQSLVEKISLYFSRVVLFLAFLCFGFWFFVLKSGAELALVNAISVLIIACPCALALATPVSNLRALFQALKLKVLFKSSDKIEDLSKCDFAVFDKTGVLTQSKLKVSRHFLSKNLDLNELFAFMTLSNHPVSASIRDFLQDKIAKFAPLNFTQVKELRAKGIVAFLNGLEFVGANAEFLGEKGIKTSEKFENTHFIFAKNGEILAFFEFESVLRGGAAELVGYLKKLKIPIKMLTGDNEKAAAKIASKLDIADFAASCLPENKMQIVANLSKSHRVLMVGDGVNDALALKNAAVAVSLRQGADLAAQSSDIILLKNDLNALKQAIVLAKKTFVIIKQNLAFSLCYNALTIPLAFAGLINPLIAAASMSASSLVVVLNALRIRSE